jgi:MoxR-like ATPase
MDTEQTSFENRVPLELVQEKMAAMKASIQQVIVGQNLMIDQILVALLCEGHLLLEGVPGIAKTLTAKLVAQSLDMAFGRIQFTPDLMPSDVIGTSIFDLQKGNFEFKHGPVFTQLLVIDEINRAPAKTQSALFEVMEERQITVDGTTYPMERPFMVVATQNPIEHEGTYRLPEAQLDRFMFKIEIDYPTAAEEVEILHREQARIHAFQLHTITPVMTAAELANVQQLVRSVHVEPRLIEYIAAITVATREHHFLYWGASPRASLALLKAAKGFAAIRGRDFVTPDDVREAALPVLNHRVTVAPEREMEGITSNEIIKQIVQNIEVPR